jgi:hypothetical protein
MAMRQAPVQRHVPAQEVHNRPDRVRRRRLAQAPPVDHERKARLVLRRREHARVEVDDLVRGDILSHLYLDETS